MSDERIVRLNGEDFRAAWPVPVMALAEFAHVSQGGADSNDMDGLAAMYDLFESVIDPDDWDRFKRHAKKSRATDKDLMLLVRKVITGQTDRPTSRASDSSDGPVSTEPKSESARDSSEPADLHLRVVRRLEAEGRPDKALLVMQAGEEQARRASVA